jgi:hypothetical protein
MEGRQGKEKKKRRRSKEKKKPEGVKIDVDSQDCGWLIVGPKGSSQTFFCCCEQRKVEVGGKEQAMKTAGAKPTAVKCWCCSAVASTVEQRQNSERSPQKDPKLKAKAKAKTNKARA